MFVKVKKRYTPPLPFFLPIDFKFSTKKRQKVKKKAKSKEKGIFRFSFLLFCTFYPFLEFCGFTILKFD